MFEVYFNDITQSDIMKLICIVEIHYNISPTENGQHGTNGSFTKMQNALFICNTLIAFRVFKGWLSDAGLNISGFSQFEAEMCQVWIGFYVEKFFLSVLC